MGVRRPHERGCDRMNEIVETILNKLKRIRRVRAVYMFGSYATGRQLPFSDIDICVIGEALGRRERSEICALSSEKIQISIFDELPIYIKFKVFKEGVLLFQRDKTFLHRIIFSTVREYLDFRPVIERFRQAYAVG